MIFRVYDYIASSAHYYLISERLAYKQPEKLTLGGSLGIVDCRYDGTLISHRKCPQFNVY